LYLSFFLQPPSPPGLYPLSLHDALPISTTTSISAASPQGRAGACCCRVRSAASSPVTGSTGSRSAHCSARRGSSSCPAATSRRRSEEHTSELQSRFDLVCRLLLEKKKKN